MFTKEVVDSMRQAFHDSFEKFSEKDKEMAEVKEQIISLIIKKYQPPKDFMNDLEDALYDVLTESSALGYYIGIKDGAEMSNALIQQSLPEQLLKIHNMRCE